MPVFYRIVCDNISEGGVSPFLDMDNYNWSCDFIKGIILATSLETRSLVFKVREHWLESKHYASIIMDVCLNELARDCFYNRPHVLSLMSTMIAVQDCGCVSLKENFPDSCREELSPVVFLLLQNIKPFVDSIAVSVACIYF